MFLAFSFNVDIIIVKRYERVAETERDRNYLLLLLLYGGIGASFSASGIARLVRLESYSLCQKLRHCLLSFRSGCRTELIRMDVTWWQLG